MTRETRDTDPDDLLPTADSEPSKPRARRQSFGTIARESAAKILGAATVFVVSALAAATISVPLWIQTCSIRDDAQDAKKGSVAATEVATVAQQTATVAVRVANTADRQLDASYDAVKDKVDPAVEGLLAWQKERKALLDRLERLEKRVGLPIRRRPPPTPPAEPADAAKLGKPLPPTPAAAEAAQAASAPQGSGGPAPPPSSP